MPIKELEDTWTHRMELSRLWATMDRAWISRAYHKRKELKHNILLNLINCTTITMFIHFIGEIQVIRSWVVRSQQVQLLKNKTH
jgi:hypothetical protein